jgi:thiamine-phosphate pyrophosphorylase
MQEKSAPAPRLLLMPPPIEEVAAFADRFAAACADVVALIARFSARDVEPAARVLQMRVQERGCAFLLADEAVLAAKIGADGAHLSNPQAFRAALPVLKPGRIAGAGGLISRHDAMLAGEAGADYVMFGEPDAAGRRPSFAAVLERVAWWAEIFEIPCVAYAAALDEIPALVGAGADFVALGGAVSAGGEGTAPTIEEALRRLKAPASARP